jgi:hypothetical protein
MSMLVITHIGESVTFLKVFIYFLSFIVHNNIKLIMIIIIEGETCP